MAELVYRAICKAPVEAQPFLSSQIFLVGGSTKFWGFKERLWQELRGLLPEVGRGLVRAALFHHAYFLPSLSIPEVLLAATCACLPAVPVVSRVRACSLDNACR